MGTDRPLFVRMGRVGVDLAGQAAVVVRDGDVNRAGAKHGAALRHLGRPGRGGSGLTVLVAHAAA